MVVEEEVEEELPPPLLLPSQRRLRSISMLRLVLSMLLQRLR